MAAKANPNRLADANDGNGGGTYADNNVTDEFYWAAAELFTTTGASNYRADVTGSSLFRGAGFNQGGFDWWWTAGLGDTTLAIVPNGLPASDVSATKQAFAGYADRLLNQANSQGYPVPTSPSGGYYWGSNSTVANAANVLALAHDFTGQARYRAGVYQALDYLFGRNPFNFSYISGYGERAARNMHHRFWANQLDASSPNPPPGALAGGPNVELQDPVASAQLAGCRPQKCYLDDIEAWSLNEVTINWNSALAWLAYWAAEKVGASTQDTTPPSAPGTPTASGTTATGTTLSWPAATDNVAVTGYDILRAPGTGAFTQVGTAPGTPFTDTGLSPNTTYRYQVRARDAAGNTSPVSPTVTVTTLAGDGGGCTVAATTQTQWATGYVIQPVAVTNPGTTTITGWTVTFTLPAGHTVTGHWNATLTTSGQTVTVRGNSNTSTVAPGGQVEWGLQASRPSGNTALPSGYTCTPS
jgi:endoglucanase